MTTLSLLFSIPLTPVSLPQWRGAVATRAEEQIPGCDLFHQHGGGGDDNDANDPYIRRYPLIQYRVRDGYAVLWGMGEGLPLLQQWLGMNVGRTLRVGAQEYPVQLLRADFGDEPLEPAQGRLLYSLKDWLALNTENYKVWFAAEGLAERVVLLDGLLTSHLASFFGAAGLNREKRGDFSARLEHLQATRKVMHKGNAMVAFNTTFSVDWNLPNGIALGHAVSHGFGVTSKVLRHK